MWFKLIFLISLSWVRHETEALSITVLFDQYDNIVLDIFCGRLEPVPLRELDSKRNIVKNLTEIHVRYCMALPFVQLFETLEMANNQTSKALYLKDISNLEAKHLTGLDECSVKKLSVTIFRQKNVAHDLFSTILKLEELMLDVPEETFLPDLSSLRQLKSLTLEISFMAESEGHVIGKFVI